MHYFRIGIDLCGRFARKKGQEYDGAGERYNDEFLQENLIAPRRIYLDIGKKMNQSIATAV